MGDGLKKFIEVYLIYNVVLISGIRQSELVLYIYVYIYIYIYICIFLGLIYKYIKIYIIIYNI